MCHRLWPRAGPFWGLLGIERLTGVFELGDLIECSCHNISNTVYSPIMTQLGRHGHITQKETTWEGGGQRVGNETALNFFVGLFLFFSWTPPFGVCFNHGIVFFPSYSFSVLLLLLGFLSDVLRFSGTCRMSLSTLALVCINAKKVSECFCFYALVTHGNSDFSGVLQQLRQRQSKCCLKRFV